MHEKRSNGEEEYLDANARYIIPMREVMQMPPIKSRSDKERTAVGLFNFRMAGSVYFQKNKK